MCLLFFSYRMTPGYPLVVAANRDEFLARPTARLDYLNAGKTLLAGRDLRGGGTWLGISADLRFAAITNYRNPAANRPEAPSRGEILMNYLTGTMSASSYLQALAKEGEKYNGCNVILGDARNLYSYSNISGEIERLSPGFYGLSNHLLDTPWPKVVRGKELLYPYMVATDQIQPQILLQLLTDSRRPADEELPSTGVGLEWERLLSTIFIDGPGYGTRSSAIISVGDGGKIDFTEHTWSMLPDRGSSGATVHLTLNE